MRPALGSILSRHLVLLVLALSGSALGAPTVDSGDWLAQELDLQSPEKFQTALALDNLKQLPADAVDTADPVQDAVAAGDYQKLTSMGRFEEALAVIDQLILETSDRQEGESAIIKLADDRLKVQEELDRSVEALMEKYDLKLPSAKH